MDERPKDIATFLRTFEEAQGANSAAKQVRQKAAESPVSSGFKQGPQPGSRGDARGGFSAVKDAVPVLCAITDRLTERTDCLLSEGAWKLLNEERAFDVVFKDAPSVGKPQKASAETVQQSDNMSTRAYSLENHVTKEAFVSKAAVASLSELHQQDSCTSPDESLMVNAEEKPTPEEFCAKQQGDQALQEMLGKVVTRKWGGLVAEGSLYQKDKALGQTATQQLWQECCGAEVSPIIRCSESAHKKPQVEGARHVGRDSRARAGALKAAKGRAGTGRHCQDTKRGCMPCRNASGGPKVSG
ncbi:hypothetical protein HPB50_019063 [Hyalomma asiaticum]|uniref:Uncharacterized protein n=1 Tax=Hyalomma asiaticum TaxID=266040 RepID=A0ACB7TKM9_HYAAI|nr:hypothetical protein HPB50_019063 [Hyalomma asiaticum]